MKRLFYKKSQRLLSNSQFKTVLSYRLSAGCGSLKLYVRPNQLPCPRFGLSIAKNAGTAVVRNRIKRLAREAFRLHQHNLPAGLDYVLIIWPKMSKKTASKDSVGLPTASYNQFEEIFLKLVKKAVGKRSMETASDAPEKNG